MEEKEEMTVEQINVATMEAAEQSGTIKISHLTASMFKAALQMDSDIAELLTCFDCTYSPEQMDALTTRLNDLYMPLRDAIFQEIGLYIGDNSFQSRCFDGL